MKTLAVLFVIALALSSLLMPAARSFFIRIGKLDHPDPRKLHRIAVPRSGGLALVSAYLLAVVLILIIPAPGNYVFDQYGSFLSRLLPAVAIVFLTGLFDDWLNLQPKYKLLGQFAAACFAYWAGIRLFDPASGYEWLAFAATAFWLILCSNAFNLTDGTDGLAGTLGVLSSLGIIVVALSLDYYALALVFAPLLGAILPFLRANWPPAKLFLGDTGSLTLGFLIGCGGAALARHFPGGDGLMAALLILTLPMLEASLSSLRRILRGQSIFTADSYHIHHQLKRQGHDDGAVLLQLGMLSLLGTIIAVVQIGASPLQRFLLVAPFFAYLSFKVSDLRYPEFNVLWEAILGGRIRNWFRHQILLRTFEEDLTSARTAAQTIQLVADCASQLGLLELNINLVENALVHPPLGTEIDCTYLVRIDLPAKCWINFRVPVWLKRTENPASDFASIVIRVLNSQRLEQFRQESANSDPLLEATLA